MTNWLSILKPLNSPDKTGHFQIGQTAMMTDADEWQRLRAVTVALITDRIGRSLADGRHYAVHWDDSTPPLAPALLLHSSLLSIALVEPTDAAIGEIVIRSAFRAPDDWRTVDTEDGRHFVLEYAYWKRVR